MYTCIPYGQPPAINPDTHIEVPWCEDTKYATTVPLTEQHSNGLAPPTTACVVLEPAKRTSSNSTLPAVTVVVTSTPPNLPEVRVIFRLKGPF